MVRFKDIQNHWLKIGGQMFQFHSGSIQRFATLVEARAERVAKIMEAEPMNPGSVKSGLQLRDQEFAEHVN